MCRPDSNVGTVGSSLWYNISKSKLKYQLMSPRPRGCRRVRINPNITYFKPQCVPMSVLEIVNLTVEELEALRLRNIKDLEQNKCAEMMNTSQSTFQRILESAYKKITDALVNGKAIEITK